LYNCLDIPYIADKFAGCKNMEEVKQSVDEVREMAKKEKPAE
jgi:hypothetical protein